MKAISIQPSAVSIKAIDAALRQSLQTSSCSRADAEYMLYILDNIASGRDWLVTKHASQEVNRLYDAYFVPATTHPAVAAVTCFVVLLSAVEGESHWVDLGRAVRTLVEYSVDLPSEARTSVAAYLEAASLTDQSVLTRVDTGMGLLLLRYMESARAADVARQHLMRAEEQYGSDSLRQTITYWRPPLRSAFGGTSRAHTTLCYELDERNA